VLCYLTDIIVTAGFSRTTALDPTALLQNAGDTLMIGLGYKTILDSVTVLSIANTIVTVVLVCRTILIPTALP
jgi:hypothetical protein